MHHNFMRRILLLLSIALYAACGSPDQLPSEVKRGSPEYPVDNPHPTHFVEFTAAIPATLSVSFVAGYSASAACQKTVGLGVYAPYTISVPIELQGGPTPHGVVTVDRYLAGQCDWHFEGITYLVPNAWPHEGALANYDTRTPRSNERSADRVNVWCARDKKPANPKLPENCMGWWMLTHQGWIRPAASESLPVDDQKPEPPVTIFSGASNIEIRFHDADLSRWCGP